MEDHKISGLGAFVAGAALCVVALMGMKSIEDSAREKDGDKPQSWGEFLFRPSKDFGDSRRE